MASAICPATRLARRRRVTGEARPVPVISSMPRLRNAPAADAPPQASATSIATTEAQQQKLEEPRHAAAPAQAPGGGN